MARYTDGINGTISGKVGSVVGSSWKQVKYLRSKGHRSRNRKSSPAQEDQRARFGLATRLIKKLTGLFQLTYQDQPGITGNNRALRNIVNWALVGLYPNISIDYSKVVMAQGSLSTTIEPAVASTVSGELKFSWLDSTGLGNAKSDDKVILIAYCEEIDEAVYSFSMTERSAEEDILPARFFSGKQVHTWISFMSKDGRQVADSKYTGLVTVA